MAQTVKIDQVAYAGLRELADRDHVTLQEALAKAIEVARRDRFFQDLDRGYGEMTEEEWAEENAERELWDQTLMDGLKDEPTPVPAEPAKPAVLKGSRARAKGGK
jgi:hypothetical protein